MRDFVLVRLRGPERPVSVSICVVIAAMSFQCLMPKPGDIASPIDGGIPPLADADVASANEMAQASFDHDDASDVLNGQTASGVRDTATDGSTDEDVAAEAQSDATDDQWEGSSSPDGALPPLGVDPSHLRLWLAADKGVTCNAGRVTTWVDQSGNHDDAALRQKPVQLGPRCQITTAPHVIKGVDLPYFSAPTGGGNVVDETLDVDLTFLAKSEYTIFVVERRWADPPTTNGQAEYFLGTTVPLAQESMVGATGSCSTLGNRALQFGYVSYSGPTQLVLDQACNSITWNVANLPSMLPIALSEDTGSFDATRGHELWINGVAVSALANVEPLQYAGGGAVGRGLVQTTGPGFDTRFRGDIAEVVVYSAALSDAERLAVEAYLHGHWF